MPPVKNGGRRFIMLINKDMNKLRKKLFIYSAVFLTLMVNFTQNCYAVVPTMGAMVAVGLIGAAGAVAVPLALSSGKNTDTTSTPTLNQALSVRLSRSINNSLGYRFTRLSTTDTYANAADNIGRPYEELIWPVNTPIVHTYNPFLYNPGNLGDPNETNVRQNAMGLTIFPEFTLTARIGNIDASRIPSAQIQTELANNRINNVECFIVVQNNPWVTGTDILFRPQPWLHQNAKVGTDAGNSVSDILAYHAPLGQSFTQLNTNGTRLSTHPGVGLVFSSQYPVLGQFDFNNTHIFYTVCIELRTDCIAPLSHPVPRAAITLHILCSDRDHEKIKTLILGFDHNELSLEDFFQKLENEHIINTRILRHFTKGIIKIRKGPHHQHSHSAPFHRWHHHT